MDLTGQLSNLSERTYRHLYEGEKRTQANRLQTLVQDALDEEGTTEDLETQNPRTSGGFENGRYWARTSDPQLVERDRAFANRDRQWPSLASKPFRRRWLGRITRAVAACSFHNFSASRPYSIRGGECGIVRHVDERD